MPNPYTFPAPKLNSSAARRIGLTVLVGLGLSCQPHRAMQPSDAATASPAAERESQRTQRTTETNPSAETPPAETERAEKRPPVELLHPRQAHAWLGVELRARDPQLPGVLVERVLPGSPAETAHIQAGDIILSLGSQALNSPQEVSAVVRTQSDASTQALSIQRAGQTHLLKIRFERMPEFEDRLRLAFVGREAPEISGMVAFQGEVSSLKQLRGQVVVLEFWASFCQVCRIMGPTLDDWHKSYLAQGAQVVGITVDLPQVGLEVARRAQMEYPLGSDPDQEITRSYMASQIPTLFIIDAEGIIRDAVVGYSRERLADTEALIKRLLSERS